MRRVRGVLFVFLVFSLAPAIAQSPQYRRGGPPPAVQDECPQGRQIRAQKSYPSNMTDCEVLDADTLEMNRRGRQPPPQAAAPPPVVPKQPSPEEKEKQQVAEDLQLGYSTITISDFILDSKELIAGSKKIAILGYYRKVGNIEYLFADQTAAFLADRQPTALSIPLLTEDANRGMRAYFLKCNTNFAQGGCWTRIRGYASTCSLTVFGSSTPKPCLSVDAGWIQN